MEETYFNISALSGRFWLRPGRARFVERPSPAPDRGGSVASADGVLDECLAERGKIRFVARLPPLSPCLILPPHRLLALLSFVLPRGTGVIHPRLRRSRSSWCRRTPLRRVRGDRAHRPQLETFLVRTGLCAMCLASSCSLKCLICLLPPTHSRGFRGRGFPPARQGGRGDVRRPGRNGLCHSSPPPCLLAAASLPSSLSSLSAVLPLSSRC